jgi:hypothetical protein
LHCTCPLSAVKRPSELATKDAFRNELVLKGWQVVVLVLGFRQEPAQRHL